MEKRDIDQNRVSYLNHLDIQNNILNLFRIDQ